MVNLYYKVSVFIVVSTENEIMAKKRKFPIHNDESTLSLPFPLDELENYLRLDLKNLTLEGDELVYFIIRATNTAKQVRELRSAVELEIKRRSILTSQKQVASIDPLEAAKFLTREQQMKLLDQISRDQVLYIERQKEKWAIFASELANLQSSLAQGDVQTAQRIVAYLAGPNE